MSGTTTVEPDPMEASVSEMGRGRPTTAPSTMYEHLSPTSHQLPLTTLRFKFAETLTVRVGLDDDAREFLVYSSTIKEHSTFFAAACSERWTSSGTLKGVVNLPDDHPLIFDLYLRCVHTGEVDLDDLERFVFSGTDMSDPEERDEAVARFIRLYVLADKLGDCASANMIIDALIEYVGDDWWICNAHIRLAFDNTPELSPLRRFLIDTLAYNCTAETSIRDATR